MKRLTLLPIALCVLFLSTAAFAGGDGWHTSWDTASKESKKTGKPIMMDFTGSDWCGWCIKLKKEVFDTPAFKTWAAKNVVLMEVDFPRQTKLDAKTTAQNEKLAEKYGVQGFPTIVFADTKGTSLGELGYEEGGPANWTKLAEKKIKAKK